MDLSTAGLVLSPEAMIDLQLHTTYSDGIWTPEALLDHLAHEQFGLAAITDHDRVDSIPVIQKLALDKNMPVLPAVEMTCEWQGEMTDILCFGLDPDRNDLGELCQKLRRRQQDNTREVYENLRKKGYELAEDPAELDTLLETPTPRQLHELVALVKGHGYGTGELSAGQMVLGAGGAFATHDVATVIEAAHKNEAVCVIAHPGRQDGFVTYDVQVLDQFRREFPIDGLEVYYPVHTPEQTALFLEYAERHNLLVSSGSDSHSPENPPIKYPAKLSRALLERVGIPIKA